MITNKIHESKSSILKRTWKFFFWGLTTLSFFIIIMVIVLTRTSEFIPSLDMNNNTVMANFGFSNIYLMTELAASDKFL